MKIYLIPWYLLERKFWKTAAVYLWQKSQKESQNDNIKNEKSALIKPDLTTIYHCTLWYTLQYLKIWPVILFISSSY